MKKIIFFFIFSLFDLFASQITEPKFFDDSILNQKYPNFIKFQEIKNYTPFNNSYIGSYWLESVKDIPEELESFSNIFNYLKFEKVQDKIYALGINSLGFWLIINENKKTKPYFIGIAQDKFIHIKISSIYRLIKDDKLQLECSIIKQTSLGSRPMISEEDFPKYKALKENLLLSIDINIIKQDSDGDGYNDIFENYIGLNPKSKDSDNDGINDDVDFNPLYKSIDNEYTNAFNKYINGGYIHKFDNSKTVTPIFVKEHQIQSDINPFKFDIYIIENTALKNIAPKTNRVLLFMKNKDRNNFNITDSEYRDIIKTNDNEFEITSAYENGSTSCRIKKEGNDWILNLISATVY